MADDKNLNTVQQYVGDMIALESHIEEAIDRQLDLTKDHQRSHDAVNHFHSFIKNHRDGLKEHLQSIGGSESSPVKNAIAGLFGVAAGVIDKVRTEAVSKALRDDYTAFNHAAIGYGMLYTTAKLLGQESTAQLAQTNLRDYASAVKMLEDLVPDVVAWELKKDGHTFTQGDSTEQATEVMYDAWRDTGISQHKSSSATNERMGSSSDFGSGMGSSSSRSGSSNI